VDSFTTSEVDRGTEHHNVPWLATLLTKDIGYHGHIQKAARKQQCLFFPPNCLGIVKSYEKVYYKTGLRKWMKNENIDDSRKRWSVAESTKKIYTGSSVSSLMSCTLTVHNIT
jgi:hypothetical protein